MIFPIIPSSHGHSSSTHHPWLSPEVSKVQEACAFLGDGMAHIDHLEEQVHGRQRRSDEMYFGVAVQVQARK